MKISIIGCTGHISYVLRALKDNPHLKLAGIAPGHACDDENHLREIQKLQPCTLYQSYRKMLDEVRPDVVGIGSLYTLNGPLTLECLERGIHCMTEKAIAHDLPTLEKIKSTSHKMNRKVIGMHAMRYTPQYFAGWNAIQEGRIGTPRLISSQKSYKFGNHRPEFYKTRSTYGGTINWVASHALDWSHWMMGPFKTLLASHSTSDNFGYQECESHAAIHFTTVQGGMGTITADFFQPLKSKISGDDQARIAGEKGIISIRHGKATICTHGEEIQELPLEPEGSIFGDFCREIEGSGKCRISTEETFEVTRACLLATQSADCGQPIAF